jgi:hypothetical protein
MKNVTYYICFLFLFGISAHNLSKAQSKVISNKDWDEFLNKYVSEGGKVNYSEIIRHTDNFNNYIILLSNNKPGEGWTDNEKKAYWINAYNAFIIKLILDHYPVKSIKEIKDDMKSWSEMDFIIIKGKNYSLKDIEYKVLLKDFKDKRILFALCNATKSGPSLLNHAYIPEKLDSLLDNQTKRFINDTYKNNLSGSKIVISEIFKWNKDYFGKGNSAIIDFINKYANIKLEKNIKIGHMKYNWNINQ